MTTDVRTTTRPTGLHVEEWGRRHARRARPRLAGDQPRRSGRPSDPSSARASRFVAPDRSRVRPQPSRVRRGLPAGRARTSPSSWATAPTWSATPTAGSVRWWPPRSRPGGDPVPGAPRARHPRARPGRSGRPGARARRPRGRGTDDRDDRDVGGGVPEGGRQRPRRVPCRASSTRPSRWCHCSGTPDRCGPPTFPSPSWPAAPFPKLVVLRWAQRRVRRDLRRPRRSDRRDRAVRPKGPGTRCSSRPGGERSPRTLALRLAAEAT